MLTAARTLGCLGGRRAARAARIEDGQTSDRRPRPVEGETRIAAQLAWEPRWRLLAWARQEEDLRARCSALYPCFTCE